MTDITDIILNYRNATREMWNRYFLERQFDEDSFSIEVDLYFEKIQQELFKALVTTKVFDKEITYSEDKSLTEIVVSPNLGPKGFQALFAKNQSDNHTEWDFKWIKTEGNKFNYVNFFDWTVEKVMDCQYIRVELTESSEFPDLIGRHFLFDAWNVKYLKN